MRYANQLKELEDHASKTRGIKEAPAPAPAQSNESSTHIKEIIRPSKLLQRLQRHHQKSPIRQLGHTGVSNETLNPRALPSPRGFFDLQVLHDLVVVLVDDIGVHVGLEAPDCGEGLTGFVESAVSG